MNTGQIDRLLRCLVPAGYVGTFPSDAIPIVKRRPAYFVVNTDPRRERGEHWIAIVLLSNGIGEYFDPLALDYIAPPTDLYLQATCRRYRRNNLVLQHPQSLSCGLFCCVFIFLRAHGVSFESFLHHFQDNTTLDENEQHVHKVFHLMENACL